MLLDANAFAVQLQALARGRIPANATSAALVGTIAASVIAQMECQPYPVILGMSGSQGSGKSTLSALLKLGLEELHGKRVAVLSLDDFYLPLAHRQALAERIHPLCVTRGVPGTHEVSLLLRTISRLLIAGGDDVNRWPRFDKLADERAPQDKDHTFTGRPDLIVIEGWCVGLQADRVPAWSGPMNALEAEADPDGRWLAWSMQCLRDDYAVLWQLLDVLVGIRLPDIECVIASRLLQEEGLVAQGEPAKRGMCKSKVTRFVQHYERLTVALWSALADIAHVLADRDVDFAYKISIPSSDNQGSRPC